MLLFDHGERRSGVPAALERLGVDARGTRLPAGDYVVSDRVVIERKGPTDLAASIKDRRLFEQLARLADAYPSVVLIVEGDPVHMHEAAWQGALGRALTLGASVLRTEDARDSAAWIGRLYRLEGKPASRPRGVPRVRRPTEDHLQTAEDVLRCLPGVSTVGAGRLDAEHRDPLLLEPAQEIAVVAGDLDRLCAGAQAEALGHRLGVEAGVAQPAIRIGGKVGVVGEDRLRALLLGELHQQALAADVDAERIERLRAAQVLRLQVGVGERRGPQVHEDLRERRAAEPASQAGPAHQIFHGR